MMFRPPESPPLEALKTAQSFKDWQAKREAAYARRKRNGYIIIALCIIGIIACLTQVRVVDTFPSAPGGKAVLRDDLIRMTEP